MSADPGGIEIGWCRDRARAEAAAEFFVAHADAAYISHSELQFGRAVAPGQWISDLRAKLVDEAAQAIASAQDELSGPTTRLALAIDGGTIVGMAFVSFAPGVRVRFGVLEDLIVSPVVRGQGVGRHMLDWIARECRSRGFARLFLESGLANESAHRFFHHQGFAQTSIVMMRDL